ncbi:MAG: NAD-dependent dehydrogenase subunit, partial [uncultured bacterium]
MITDLKNLLHILIHISIILAFSPLLFGIIAKTKALFGGRCGIRLFQPYYDLIKLFKKACVYSTTTTWIFRMAPIISLTSLLLAGMLMPIALIRAPISFWGDMILFAYLFALGRFFTILAALDTGSSFEGMGASREATFSCLSEITFFLDLAILSLLSGSLCLTDMIGENILASWNSMGPALLLVMVSLFLIILSENSRIPVDDPNTHLELTMIHEVMVLDHSGVDFAYITYGMYAKLFIWVSFLIQIFIPHTSNNILVNSCFYVAALILVSVLIGVIESTMARLRLNRVPYLLILAFLASVLGLIVVLVKGNV